MASSVGGGRPGMPSGADAWMGGSLASIGGVQSALSINGMSGKPPAFGGLDPSFPPAGTSYDPALAMRDFNLPPMPGHAGSISSALGGGMPPSMTLTSGSLAGLGGGTFSGSAPYAGMGGNSFGSMPPSSSAGAQGLPVTPAYERAAQALSSQVASGGSFCINLEGDAVGNPFEAPFDPKFSNFGAPSAEVHRETSSRHLQGLGNPFEAPGPYDPKYSNFALPGNVHRETSSNRGEVMVQTLQSMESKSLGAGDGGSSSHSHGGRGGGGAAHEATVNAPSASFPMYGQPMDMPMAGYMDGPSYAGGAAAASGSAHRGADYRNLNGSGGGPPVKQDDKQEDGTFNFPTTGSFVAAPYDDAGLPSYYDAMSRSPPGANDAVRSSSDALGATSMRREGLHDEGNVRTRGMPSSAQPGGAGNGYGYDGYGGSALASSATAYDSYMGGAGKGGAGNGYDGYGGNALASSTNAYDGYMGGAGKGGGNGYDGRGGGRHGMSDYRGGPDYSPSQSYGNSASYSGVPPAGKTSHASIAPGGRPGGSVLATSGSFVASPFAEGAPSVDYFNPRSPAPYSPPAPTSPMPFNTLQTSGSFVATPFAEGAPTPDMFAMSMPQLGFQGSYPDTYGSLPPPSLNLYGSAPPNAGGSFGGSSPFGGYGSGQSPFVGFDAEVPGKTPFSSSLGPSGSFVAMAPSSSKEGAGSSTVKFSDQKNDKAGTDAQSRSKMSSDELAREDASNPNSKARMHRSSRDRDGAAPRTKRKAERRACC